MDRGGLQGNRGLFGLRSRVVAVVVVGGLLFVTACVGDNPVMSGPVPTAVPQPADAVASAEPAEVPVLSFEDEGAVAGPASPEDLSAVTELDDTVVVERQGEFPDVVSAQATQASDGTWRFDVTLSSPYDTPEKYADAWRVVGLDGEEYGLRVLLHDHASEQPFTRSESGIEIPDSVTEVWIEARDLIDGWGGQTLLYELPAA